MPLTTHTAGQSWTGRASISKYMYNHIGHFSDASKALVKSLFFGGVTRRFPQLRFGLLEGNGSWGSDIYVHLHERWEKRNRQTVRNDNPANVDAELLHRLCQEYGRFSSAAGASTSTPSAPPLLASPRRAAARRSRPTAWTTSSRPASSNSATSSSASSTAPTSGPSSAPSASSDVGHWDVVDFAETLAQSGDLVEQGVLSQEDFQAPPARVTGFVRTTGDRPTFITSSAATRQAAPAANRAGL